MVDDKSKNSDLEKEEMPSRVKFHFIKSPFFRVVHVDGVYGGITPHGYIHMAVFNERSAIPQLVEHELKDRQVGPEIDRVSKEGIVREIESDLLFDVETARSLAGWLTSKIEEVEKIKRALEKSKD